MSGYLTVIERLEEKCGKHYMYSCKCRCGKYVKVASCNLSGHTKSCGCFKSKHGKSSSRIYRIWQNMLCRCRYDHNTNKKDYIDRGITVCEKWEEFENFYADMKVGYKDNLTIDRIDNDRGYFKENCKWSTMKEQASNKRRSSLYKLTYKQAKEIRKIYSSRPATCTEMAKKYGVSKTTIVNIINNSIYPTINEINRFSLQCKKCHRKWIPFKANPKMCAKCGTRSWDK